MAVYVTMSLQDRLESGEVIAADILRAPQNENEAAQNRVAIMRHMTRFGLSETFSASLSTLNVDAQDPTVPSRTEDACGTYGLFVTAKGLARAALHGPDPILSHLFPDYITESAGHLGAAVLPRANTPLAN